MVHDWGSRDATFLEINNEVLTRLPEVVNGGEDFVTVPMQGSGTFAVEAMLTTFVPRGRQGAGADQRRLRPAREEDSRHREARASVHETPEDTPPDLAEGRGDAEADAAITHVFTVHCETTSGILNPIVALGALAQKLRQGLPDRLDERVRRAAARCQRDQARRGRGLVEQVHRGRAGPRLRDLPQGRAGEDQGQRHHAGARPARPVAAISRRPGNTASRRRST